MFNRMPRRMQFLRRNNRAIQLGFMPLAFAPILMWFGFFMKGEPGLLAVAAGVSLYLLVLALSGGRKRTRQSRDSITGLALRDDLIQRTDDIIDYCANAGQTTASIVVEIDDLNDLAQHYGQPTCDRIMETVADRIMVEMRADDAIARLGDSRIAVTLHPIKRIDLELALQIGSRLQATLEEPIAVDASSVYVTVSVGICTLARARHPGAEGLIDSATIALREASRCGPSSIRVYSPEMKRVEVARKALIEEARNALESGEICAWFQPQICTDTGQVSGIEALARWIHPDRGVISPAEFLPALDQAGLLEHLSEVMLQQALQVLRDLDLENVHIPRVGVNFASGELRNPKLIDRVGWELDRFDLLPDRLSIEILETVVAGTPDDTLVSNIAALSNMGCHIDLDDFGTGHASITSLRRFSIDRLKIDRSFVTRCDCDPDQQRMLTAILSMAERLGLETLAEGLETVSEHALISQLGVGHAQGFGIARPMPPDRLSGWVREHHAKVAPPPEIGRTAP